MADDENFTINGKSISDLRVVDLKKELEQKGLSKVGTKVQLTERLKAQLLLEQKEKPEEKPEPSTSVDKKDSDLSDKEAAQDKEAADKNDFIKKYFAEQQRNLELQMQMKKRYQEEQVRLSAAESADDSQPSAAEEEVSKEVTSTEKVKAVTNAPAIESVDNEMAKSRKSRHASKDEKKESKTKEAGLVLVTDDAETKHAERKKSRHRRSPSPEETVSRHRHRHRSGSSSPDPSPTNRRSSRRSAKVSRDMDATQALSLSEDPIQHESSAGHSPRKSSSGKEAKARDHSKSDSKEDADNPSKHEENSKKTGDDASVKESGEEHEESKGENRKKESKENGKHSLKETGHSKETEGGEKETRRNSAETKEEKESKVDGKKVKDKAKESLAEDEKKVKDVAKEPASEHDRASKDGGKQSKEEEAEAKPAAAEQKSARRWRRSHSGSKPSEAPSESKPTEDRSEPAVGETTTKTSSSHDNVGKNDKDSAAEKTEGTDLVPSQQESGRKEEKSQKLSDTKHQTLSTSVKGEEDKHHQQSEPTSKLTKASEGAEDKKTKADDSKPGRRSWRSKSREEPSIRHDKSAEETKEGDEQRGEQAEQPGLTEREKKEGKEDAQSKNDKPNLGDRPLADRHSLTPSDNPQKDAGTNKRSMESGTGNVEVQKDDKLKSKDQSTLKDGDKEDRIDKDSTIIGDKGEGDYPNRKESRKDKKDLTDKDVKQGKDISQTLEKGQTDSDKTKLSSESKDYPDRSSFRSRSMEKRQKTKGGRRDQSSSSSDSRSRSRSSSKSSKSSGSKSSSRSRSRPSSSSSSDSEDEKKSNKMQGSVKAVVQKKRSRSPDQSTAVRQQKAQEVIDVSEEEDKPPQKGEKMPSRRGQITKDPVPKKSRFSEKSEEKRDSGKSLPPVDKPVREKQVDRRHIHLGPATG